MPTFTTPGPIAATVEVAGAQVRVTASDRTDTVVRVEPIDATSRSDVKVADRTTVELDGGQLSVKTKVAGAKDGSVAITIDLPTGSTLAGYLAYSDVRADGVLGDCDLHMASGRVQLDRVDALRGNIASGEVAIDRVAGRIDVDGGAFAMRIGAVDGVVGLTNAGGQVRIGHAAADLDLSSAGCDFDVDRADGSVTATTGRGAIRIGRMTRGRATLTNGSGNIEVGIGAGTAVHVEARSDHGSVRDTVSSTGAADQAGPGVAVHARTRNGDIVVRRAAD